MSVSQRMSAAFAALLAIFVACIAFAATGSAAPYNPGPTIAVSAVNSCGPFTVTGDGFAKQETVTIRLDAGGAVLKTVQTNGSGKFRTSVTLPGGTTGSHTIVATGATGDRAAPVSIRVQNCSGIGGVGTGGNGGGNNGGSGNGGIAITGVQVAAISGAGAILLAAGTVLMISGRRRRVAA